MVATISGYIYITLFNFKILQAITILIFADGKLMHAGWWAVGAWLLTLLSLDHSTSFIIIHPTAVNMRCCKVADSQRKALQEKLSGLGCQMCVGVLSFSLGG